MKSPNNIAVLINCHGVPITPDAQHQLTLWLAGIIRAASQDAIVQIDLACAVIDILPPDETGSFAGSFTPGFSQ